MPRQKQLVQRIDLFPSAIVCSCGERFESDWSTDRRSIDDDDVGVGSAVWLFLSHQSTLLASSATRSRPHRAQQTLVRCIFCAESIGIDTYRAHLHSDHLDCGSIPDRRAVRRYVQSINGMCRDDMPTPSFECSRCLDEWRFLDLNVGTILEHEHHGSDANHHFELYITCRACACQIPLENAVGHAAFWHSERLRQSNDAAALADLFVTAPKMRAIPAGVDSIYPDPDAVLKNMDSLDRPTKRVKKETLAMPPATFTDDDDDRAPSPAAEDYCTVDVESDAESEYAPERRSVFHAPTDDNSTTTTTFDNMLIVRQLPKAPPTSSPIVPVCSLSLLLPCPPGANFLECELCGQKLVRQSFLTHLWRHTGVKRYGCRQCPKRFSRHAHAVRHCQEMHESTRQYGCPQCSATFKRKDDMDKHRRGVHTEERKRCDVCGKTFKWKSTMVNHRRRVHHSAGATLASGARTKAKTRKRR